jgi:hypothetical protein
VIATVTWAHEPPKRRFPTVPELVSDVHQPAALWNHGSVVRSWLIAASLYARFSARGPDPYAAHIIAALRSEFGGRRVFGEGGHAKALLSGNARAPLPSDLKAIGASCPPTGMPAC